MGLAHRPHKKNPQDTGTIETSDVRSMLVIHQGALGDFILALPTLGTLRKAFPQARSVILGYPRILELVENRFYADEIASIDQKGMASFFVRGGALDPALSQFFSTFDLIVVFCKDREGTVIGNLRRVFQGQTIQISPFPPWNERIHMTEHLLRELRRYHFVTSEQNPKLYLSGADQEWGKNYWRRKGLTPEEKSKAIVVHPGSGSKKKLWPLDRFVALIRTLRKDHDLRILVVLGPAEGGEIQKAFEQLDWEMGPSAPLLLKGLSLLGLASVMDGCRFYIGNDSGITHMAAALGLPTLAIFGSTDAKVWAPRGDHVVVVESGASCSPCTQERFLQCQTIECLKEIEIDDVFDGVERLGFGKV